jgi:hypothetical protein
MKVFDTNISKDQSRDTGMGVVLLLLLIFLRTKKEGVLIAAMLVHIVNMIWPVLYKPVAVVWLGISHLMGTMMSKVLLSILFFLVITPIGVLRRLFGKDSLKLRAFKASQDSATVERNHVFTAQDIEKPY